jgi:hypothetical protein
MYRYYVQRETEYFADGKWQVRREKVSETFDIRWEAESYFDRHANTDRKANIRYRIIEFWVDPPKTLCQKTESNRHYQAYGSNYGYNRAKIYDAIRDYYDSRQWE